MTEKFELKIESQLQSVVKEQTPKDEQELEELNLNSETQTQKTGNAEALDLSTEQHSKMNSYSPYGKDQVMPSLMSRIQEQHMQTKAFTKQDPFLREFSKLDEKYGSNLKFKNKTISKYMTSKSTRKTVMISIANKRFSVQPPSTKEAVTRSLKKSRVPYDWTHSAQPPFAYNRDKYPQSFQVNKSPQKFSIQVIQHLTDQEDLAEEKVGQMLKSNVFRDHKIYANSGKYHQSKEDLETLNSSNQFFQQRRKSMRAKTHRLPSLNAQSDKHTPGTKMQSPMDGSQRGDGFDSKMRPIDNQKQQSSRTNKLKRESSALNQQSGPYALEEAYQTAQNTKRSPFFDQNTKIQDTTMYSLKDQNFNKRTSFFGNDQLANNIIDTELSSKLNTQSQYDNQEPSGYQSVSNIEQMILNNPQLGRDSIEKAQNYRGEMSTFGEMIQNQIMNSNRNTKQTFLSTNPNLLSSLQRTFQSNDDSNEFGQTLSQFRFGGQQPVKPNDYRPNVFYQKPAQKKSFFDSRYSRSISIQQPLTCNTRPTVLKSQSPTRFEGKQPYPQPFNPQVFGKDHRANIKPQNVADRKLQIQQKFLPFKSQRSQENLLKNVATPRSRVADLEKEPNKEKAVQSILETTTRSGNAVFLNFQKGDDQKRDETPPKPIIKQELQKNDVKIGIPIKRDIPSRLSQLDRVSVVKSENVRRRNVEWTEGASTVQGEQDRAMDAQALQHPPTRSSHVTPTDLLEHSQMGSQLEEQSISQYESGRMSPQNVIMSKQDKLVLRELRKTLKQDRGVDITPKANELLKTLFRYYSPRCKFTGDASKMSEIVSKFKRGTHNEYSLSQEVEAIKEEYEYRKNEDFAEKYTEEYINNPNPLEEIQQYLMTEDIDEMIQYIDKVIYYKKKMENLGRRSPDYPRVYINKLFLGLSDEQAEPKLNYRKTRFFQRQPKLCHIAKMASLILLKVYDEDERYYVEETDYDRVQMDNEATNKICDDHGKGYDLLDQELKENKLLVAKFQTKLSQQRKVNKHRLMQAFVNLMRVSPEPELVILRDTLQDDSQQRDMSYDNLRQYNPVIFIKDRTVDNPLYNPPKYTEPQLKQLDKLMGQSLLSSSFKDLSQLPDTHEIKINKKIIETFVQTIAEKLEEENEDRVRSNIDSTITTPISNSDLTKNSTPIDNSNPSGLSGADASTRRDQDMKIAAKKIEIFKDRYEKLKFFEQQKIRYQNPKGIDNAETRFFESLHGSNANIMPVFSRIQQGMLDLSGYRVEPEVLDALADYIRDIVGEEQAKGVKEHQVKHVKHLVLDSIDMKDQQFSNMLEAIEGHNKIKSIFSANNEFKQESLKSLEKILQKTLDYRAKSLTTLHFRSVKTNLNITNQLVTILEECCTLKRLKLQCMDLNRNSIAVKLGQQFILNSNLIEFDISNCRMLPQQMKVVMDGLLESLENSQLQFLNLSYIVIVGEEGWSPHPRVQKPKNFDAFIGQICKLIEQTKTLVHLDISGLNFSAEQCQRIVDSLSLACESGTSQLLSVHLNENNINFETKKYIVDKLGIGIAQMDKLGNDPHDLSDQPQMKFRDKAQMDIYKKIHQLYKIEPTSRDEETHMIRHDLRKSLRDDLRQTNNINGLGTQGLSKANEVFIITRKFRKEEIVFKQSFQCKQTYDKSNYEQRWMLTINPTYNDRVPCYVCQNWNYTQLLFESTGFGFEKLTNPDLIQFLKDACKIEGEQDLVGQGENRIPLMISSLNDWLPVRMIDVRVYSQLLKSKGEGKFQFMHRKMAREKVQQLKFTPHDVKLFYYNENMKHLENPQEAKKKGYLEGKLNEIDTKVAQKWFIEKEEKMIRKCNENLKEAISGGEEQALISKIIESKDYKFDDRYGVDDDKIFDRFSHFDWLNIVNGCRDEPFKQINQINFEEVAQKGEGEERLDSTQHFVFADYCRPGPHKIIIYEPESKQFFIKDHYITPKLHEIDVEKRTHSNKN